MLMMNLSIKKILQWSFAILTAAHLVSGQGFKCSSSSKSFEPDPVDCKRFYRCVAGQTFSFMCPYPLKFDSEEGRCSRKPCTITDQPDEMADKVQASLTESGGPPEAPQQPGESTNTEDKVISSTATDNSNTLKTYKCPGNGYFPDETNCKMYFHCIDGGWGYITYHRTCKDGTSFNSQTKSCEAGAICNHNSETLMEGVEQNGGTKVETDETGGAGLEADGMDGTGTEGDGTKIDGAGTENDGTKAETDVTGLETGGTGTETDGAGLETDGIGETDDGTRAETAGTETETGGKEIDSTGADAISNGANLETGETVLEADGVGQETGGTEIGTDGEGPDPNETEAPTDPSDSVNMHSTNGPVDPTDSESTDAPPVTTTFASGGSFECKSAGFFSDPSNCNKFHRCVDWNGQGTWLTKFSFDCPAGLVFDERFSICNWPQAVPSCDGSIGDTSSTVGATTAQTTNPTSSENPTSATAPTTLKPSNEFPCPTAGFFRNPTDCNKFYRCVDHWSNGAFTLYHFTCPFGLVFDEINDLCNWPQISAPCDSSGTTSQTNNPTVNASDTMAPTDGSMTTPQATADGDMTTPQATADADMTTPQATADGDITTPQATADGDTTTPQATTDGDATTPQATTDGDATTPQATADGDTTTPQATTDEDTTTPQATTDEDMTTPQATTDGDITTDLPITDEDTITTQPTTDENTTSIEPSTEIPDGNNSTNTTFPPITLPDGLICDEEGFRRYPAKCSLFYQCNNGDGKITVTIFSCSENLVFDEASQTCTGANETELCENILPCSNATEPTGEGDNTTELPDEITTTMDDEGGSNNTTPDSEPDGSTTVNDGDEITTIVPEDGNDNTTKISDGDDENTTEPDGGNDISTTEISDQDAGSTTESDNGSSDSSTTPSEDANNSTISDEDSNNENSTTEETAVVTAGSLFDCPSAGHFEFEFDCIRFYRCIETEELDLTGLLYRCPEDYIFDKSILNVGFCRRKKPEDVCNKTMPDDLSFRIDPYVFENAILATIEFLYD